MKRWLLPSLTVVLAAAGLAFLVECVQSLGRRDYVAALMLMFIGFAALRAGSELARLAVRR